MTNKNLIILGIAFIALALVSLGGFGPFSITATGGTQINNDWLTSSEAQEYQDWKTEANQNMKKLEENCRYSSSISDIPTFYSELVKRFNQGVNSFENNKDVSQSRYDEIVSSRKSLLNAQASDVREEIKFIEDRCFTGLNKEEVKNQLRQGTNIVDGELLETVSERVRTGDKPGEETGTGGDVITDPGETTIGFLQSIRLFIQSIFDSIIGLV